MHTQPGRLVQAPSKARPKRFEVQVLKDQPRTIVSSRSTRSDQSIEQTAEMNTDSSTKYRPRGATDDSPGRKSWVSQNGDLGHAKILINQCTVRPEQSYCPAKTVLVENRSTKPASAQSLL
jgi:hypothetical protein